MKRKWSLPQSLPSSRPAPEPYSARSWAMSWATRALSILPDSYPLSSCCEGQYLVWGRSEFSYACGGRKRGRRISRT